VCLCACGDLEIAPLSACSKTRLLLWRRVSGPRPMGLSVLDNSYICPALAVEQTTPYHREFVFLIKMAVAIATRVLPCGRIVNPFPCASSYDAVGSEVCACLCLFDNTKHSLGRLAVWFRLVSVFRAASHFKWQFWFRGFRLF
jgi:hypothetical protein